MVELKGPRKSSRARVGVQEGEASPTCVNARRIMSDDITWITPTTPKYLLPANTWYPTRVCPEMYEELGRMRPDMLTSCLRACIVADYQETWDRVLLISPDEPTTDQQLDSSDGVNQGTKLRRLDHVDISLMVAFFIVLISSWLDIVPGIEIGMSICPDLAASSLQVAINNRQVICWKSHIGNDPCSIGGRTILVVEMLMRWIIICSERIADVPVDKAFVAC